MNVAIFGLGYVGAVSCACLAEQGHAVIGVDPNKNKVGLINSGQSPVVEMGVNVRISRAVAERRLRATTDHRAAIAESELALICVGTPSRNNGDLDLSYVRRVCEEIGEALRNKSEFTAIVVRSTVLPGTLRTVVLPILEGASGKVAGKHFGVGFFPEFLRESEAVDDFYNPPKIVLSSSDARTDAMLKALNADLDAPITHSEFEVAEMVKYADNTWHALKVSFANEIGSISKALKIDGSAVMDIFCQDTKLNISTKYLRPGFAFVGSCLPKDVRALNYKARRLDLELPLLNSIIPSNRSHIERAMEMVIDRQERNVGILGLCFKAGTDDLRESPVVELVERLLGKGHEIRIFDRNVNLNRLVGANQAYIYQHLPHIAKLMVDDVDDVVHHAGTIVIGHRDHYFSEVAQRLNSTQRVVDLVRIEADGRYNGICW
ncbi:MAG: nucleotide sugar dehydrogenase [Planctomycetota bacterium]